jgi:hypothetical protein
VIARVRRRTEIADSMALAVDPHDFIDTVPDEMGHHDSDASLKLPSGSDRGGN